MDLTNLTNLGICVRTSLKSKRKKYDTQNFNNIQRIHCSKSLKSQVRRENKANLYLRPVFYIHEWPEQQVV